MDERLTLNDGTEIRGHLIETNGRLFLYMYEITLQEAFELLIEPENTEAIRWERNGETGTAEGYGHLYSVTEEMDGQMITAALKKD